MSNIIWKFYYMSNSHILINCNIDISEKVTNENNAKNEPKRRSFDVEQINE